MASRMAARSTTAGTPVKSCISTRAGVKAISLAAVVVPSQLASASISGAHTLIPSSLRSRFSNSIFSEYGNRARSNRSDNASSAKIS